MNLKPFVATAVLLSGLSIASAAELDVDQYLLTYDETTDFGPLNSWFGGGDNVGFDWKVPNSAKVRSFGPTMTTFVDLPSFTIAAKSGWTLSDPKAFLGNLVYTELGGSTTGILIYADVAVNGGAPSMLSGGVAWTETEPDTGDGFRGGYFGQEFGPIVGGFNTITVSNAYMVLSASGGTFGNIAAQPQNRLSISFTAVPVPEPQTYAMLLAGLAALGWLARRRGDRA